MKELFLIFIASFALFAISSHAQTPPEEARALPDREFKILYKPRPAYPTDAGCVTGTVILRIAFLATGDLGKISIVKGLPNGLTDKAIEAAEKIKFQTMIKNGNHKTVTKQVEFSFTIQ